MNCNIIKDLIPLSSEGLCSTESETKIKEHIKTCDKCRILYESTPEINAIDSLKVETPPEKNIFKKINKKVKRHRLITIILALVLAFIIGVLSYLTYGQITKNDGCKSFETIFQTIEIKRIVKALAEGNAEPYVSSIDSGYYKSVYWSEYNELIKQDIERIESAYSAFMENRHVESIKIKSKYENLDYTEYGSYIISTAEIKFSDLDEPFIIDFYDANDGLYITNQYVDYNYNKGDTKLKHLKNALSYVDTHEVMGIRGLFERSLTRKHDGKYEKSTESMSQRFRIEERETAHQAMNNYFESGFDIIDIILSPPKYSAKNKMCYYDIVVTGADSKGKAIMTTRLYHDHLGLYIPKDDTINVYTDGCTPELKTALTNFFG